MKFGNRQKGQSLVEFIVAMLATTPLFMGIYYVGKYADLQSSAVQASRYAVFARVAQPDTGRLSNANLQDKIRARFFVRQDFSNGGQIRSNDSVASLDARNAHMPLWKDISGNPLLSDHQQVSLAFEDRAMGGPSANALRFGAFIFNVNSTPAPIKVANVQVTAVNKLAFGVTNPAPIMIGASTAAWADTLSARGTRGVQNAINTPTATIDSLIPGIVGGGLSAIIATFESSSPDFGCHKVEFVPRDRLDRTGGAGPC